jgi:hypothetical protein
MYQTHEDGTLTITVNEWIASGLTYCQFNHDNKQGLLKIYRRGYNGNTQIDVRSIKRPDRLKVIEAYLGKVKSDSNTDIFRFELDTEARAYYVRHRKPDGSPLTPESIEKYTNRASIFKALQVGLAKQIGERAKMGKRLPLTKFWPLAVKWYTQQRELYPCAPISNAKAFERVFKQWLNADDKYLTIVHKNEGNDGARIVSAKLERLLIAIWRTYDKPFYTVVHERYHEFIAGTREFVDKKTGEVYQPSDFRYKDRSAEISLATVWNYLKDVVNETAVYADRNGNFDYVNKHRPKQHRKRGKYSLSKISMDDVAMSRKSVRGWVFKYMAVDVVSGYWFRPAYIVGKPNHNTVIEAFRNMFCELADLGLPMPGELEVEYHLMENFEWLGELFPFVRFCESPTEKRAEHAIKALKYGVSKKEGHTRGRWYAKHEAFKSVRNKVKGDWVEPEYQPQTIVADDLADIEKHNNALHPLQKTYPGMTRRQVMLQNVNPNLHPVDNWHLFRYIGNETSTSIYNNDYCPVQQMGFELMDYNSLKRLKPNNREVTAYWLPETDGSINKVYLYQGDTYIGEAINRGNFDYNECAIERDATDEANMLHQNKRLARFDKFINDHRADIPNLIHRDINESRELADVTPVVVPEATQPKGFDEDFENETTDWVARAISSL